MKYTFQVVPTVDAIVADLRLQTGLDIQIGNQSTMSEGSPEEKIWFTLIADGFTPVEEVNIHTHTGEVTAIANMPISFIKSADITYLQMMLSFTLYDLGGRLANQPDAQPKEYETYAHRTYESLSWTEKNFKVCK